MSNLTNEDIGTLSDNTQILARAVENVGAIISRLKPTDPSKGPKIKVLEGEDGWEYRLVSAHGTALMTSARSYKRRDKALAQAKVTAERLGVMFVEPEGSE